MGKVRATGVAALVFALLAAATLSGGPLAGLAGASTAPVRHVGVAVPAAHASVVNMAELAAQGAAHPLDRGPGTGIVIPGPQRPGAARTGAPLFLQVLVAQSGRRTWLPPSPSPAQSFAGLDGIRNLSTGYVYIPPDTDGAVGLTKVMSGLNNNYRIWTKATGEVLSTVGTNAFWGLSGDGDAYVFDPRTLYDPINDRWIVVMLQGSLADNSSYIDIGVSQTSDPSGSYYLFSFDVAPEDLLWADFPTVGFNKDYVAVNVNMYDTTTWETDTSEVLAVDYRALRSGRWRGWVLDGSGYTSSPAATYSATERTLYVPTQIDAASGSYRVDTITGDPWSGPVYTVGATRSRGLTWTAPTGNILPQKPTAAVPHPVGLETQDDMIGSSPVVRDGFIYYTQTVGLPAGGALTHTSVLWTKLTARTGEVADGGLIDDPTATATNGGKWYSYAHIAVNTYGDAIVGFSQFSSEQWPSAGYAVRMAGDPAGAMREPVVYKAGEDQYQADYGSGRYRWGDYSKAQVDPSNDADLWVVNEYAAPNDQVPDYGGVWGTWWAKVKSPTQPTTTFAIIASAGPHGAISPNGWTSVPSGSTQHFTITPERGYHVADVRVDGRSVGALTSYDFAGVTRDHTISAAFAPDTYTITPRVGSAGHGFVSPALPQTVPFGATPSFTFTPERGYYASRLTVDGVVVGFSGPNRYSFAPVDGSHVQQVFFTVAPRQALR
jgi:hypothetical protein